MRILHVSDIHIGVENYGRPATELDVQSLPDYFAPGVDRATYLGISTRLLDFLASFDQVVQYAIDNLIDLVLFAGDAYKSRDPSQTQQREFVRRIARLADAGIPVFLTVGNHDLPHVANRATSLEIFPTLNVEKVFVGQTLETHRVTTASGDIQVVALPWIRIGQFMARDETRGLSLEHIKSEVEERLSGLLRDEVEQLDPDVPAVLCAHVNIAGATAASERSMMLGNDHILGLGTVAIPEFDYVALGNIHKHQVLSRVPPVVYAGSIERVDFSEEKEPKGFIVAEIDPERNRGQRTVDWRFVEVDARPMRTIAVQCLPGDDPTQKTLEAIVRLGDKALQDSLVRVRVEMAADQELSFHEPSVRSALSNTHLVTGIERKVHHERRTRIDTDEAERLGPLEALSKYLASKGTPEAAEKKLSEYAQRLLVEEIEGVSE